MEYIIIMNRKQKSITLRNQDRSICTLRKDNSDIACVLAKLNDAFLMLSRFYHYDKEI